VKFNHNYLVAVSRNILDSKMVSMWGEGWVELNVSKAVREWRNASANLGLFVEVEDLESKKLPPSLFFREMNCSVDTGTVFLAYSIKYRLDRTLNSRSIPISL
jgi:TGF-beta propeptide